MTSSFYASLKKSLDISDQFCHLNSAIQTLPIQSAILHLIVCNVTRAKVYT